MKITVGTADGRVVSIEADLFQSLPATGEESRKVIVKYESEIVAEFWNPAWIVGVDCRVVPKDGWLC